MEIPNRGKGWTPDADDFVLMALGANGDDNMHKGRLLSELYFTSRLLRLEREFGFRPHYFGTFSPKIDSGLKRDIALRFIEEERCSHSSPWKTDYRITSAGRHLLSEYSRAYSAFERYQAAFQTTLEETRKRPKDVILAAIRLDEGLEHPDWFERDSCKQKMTEHGFDPEVEPNREARQFLEGIYAAWHDMAIF